MNNSPTRQTIISIFRNLAAHYPKSGCKKINSFFTIINGDEHFKENAGKVYKDFENNEFWDFEWYNDGKDPHGLKVRRPSMSIEIAPPSVYIGENKEEDQFTVYVNLVDLKKCDDCGDCNRTESEINNDLVAMSKEIIEELITIGLYRDVSDNLYWLSKDQRDYLQSEAILDLSDYPEEEIINYIVPERISINPLLIHSSENQKVTSLDEVGVGFPIKFKTCISEKVNFDYRNIDVNQIAIATCETC